ncbi:protein of unknown function [Burkholderia multivorans]
MTQRQSAADRSPRARPVRDRTGGGIQPRAARPAGPASARAGHAAPHVLRIAGNVAESIGKKQKMTIPYIFRRWTQEKLPHAPSLPCRAPGMRDSLAHLSGRSSTATSRQTTSLPFAC